MTEEEIMALTLEEVIAKLSELDSEVEESEDEERINQAITEKRSLLARKSELEKISTLKAEARALQNGSVQPDKIIETRKETVMEEKKIFGTDTKEYRDAFFANLVGKATVEQRGIFADNNAYGDGVALPVTTDTMIWDQVTTAHPILADVDKVVTGLVMKVTQSTPSAITGKKDKDASSEQTFTNVDVTLAGVDYHTYVKLSFAEAKMSAGAMERYLAKEVADAIGESLAKAVFAKIISDATTAQKVDSSTVTDVFDQVKAALALAKQANDAVVYAPSSLYYSIVGAVNANGGQPYNIGSVLGCQIKKDNAATAITVVDPAMFVLNVVQDVTIDSDKDLTDSTFVIGGYMRAEGCLRKTTAAAYVG